MKLKKLLLCFICFLCILFLTGCESSNEMNNDYFEKKQDFSMLAKCRQNEMEYTLSIKKVGNQIRFAYVSPENIKDLCFVFDSEKQKVSYMGVDIDEENGQLLKAVLPEILSKSIEDSLANSGENIQGMTEYGNYTVTIDRVSGLLKTLALPNYNFKCSFVSE